MNCCIVSCASLASSSPSKDPNGSESSYSRGCALLGTAAAAVDDAGEMSEEESDDERSTGRRRVQRMVRSLLRAGAGSG